MARGNEHKTGTGSGSVGSLASPTGLANAVFTFNRSRHERARAALGWDSAADFGRPSTTAGVIEYRSREYGEACQRHDHVDNGHVGTDTAPGVIRALERLADAEERHLVLTGTQDAIGTLPLARIAAAHRRSLAGAAPSSQGPLLSLSLVLLTHRLHVAGRFDLAIDSGRESVEIARRLVTGGRTEARSALVLALDASLTTWLALNRHRDALDALRQATDVLHDLARREPVYRKDLHIHLAALDHLERGRGHGARRPGESEGGEPADLRPRERPAALSRGGDAFHRDADALYERGIQVATDGASGPGVVASAGAAVAAYRSLRADPARSGPRPVIERKLARALWRHAVVLHERLSRPRDAMSPGRESVALGQQLLMTTESGDREYDRLVGEVATAMSDLSRIAAAAGHDDEYARLVRDVEQLCGGRDRATTRAVGAALHSRAAHAGEAAIALASRGNPARSVVAAGIDASARAVAVRRSLVDDDDPVTRWELANSLLAHGHLRCLIGDGQAGAESLVDAYNAVAELPGASAAAMRHAAHKALVGACRSYPDLDIGDDWPL
jgi:hypothetical protein